MHVAVETKGIHTIGRTTMDMRTQSTEPATCVVALDADAARFVQLMSDAFG